MHTNKINRRLFLKKGSLLGATSIVSAWTIPEFLHGKTPRNYYRESGAIAPICQVKKEVYVPSPEPRVGTSVSMTYIGRRLRREEVRSTIRSSDWADTVRRRTSEDNGKNWSDWELEYKQAPTQEEFTKEGGESQRGTGPFDQVSGRLIKPVFLPRKISTRGLVELNLSELTNGNLLLIMRGSNTGLDPVKYPGRKWFSVSRDGGLNWSEVKDIRYDTGEQLYSPASIARTIRSSKTGKLYWVGNITDVPPDGNSPRYPLQIVEIDEEGPSFRKDTVTVIDDRNPEQDSEHLQLSNFSLLENRETQEMEVYLTRLGERGGGPDIWTADTYKYTLVF